MIIGDDMIRIERITAQAATVPGVSRAEFVSRKDSITPLSGSAGWHGFAWPCLLDHRSHGHAKPWPWHPNTCARFQQAIHLNACNGFHSTAIEAAAL